MKVNAKIISGLIDHGGPAGGLVLGAILSFAGRAEVKTAVVAAGWKTCRPFNSTGFGINDLKVIKALCHEGLPIVS